MIKIDSVGLGQSIRPKPQIKGPLNTSNNILYICVGGCGDFKLTEMKVHTDGTLICPNCGNCQWYLAPEELEKEEF